MAAGTVQVYNSAYTTLFQTVAGGGLRQWDDTGTNIYFYLATTGYTPSDTHTTRSDFNANLVTGTPGATPVAATSLAVTQGTAGDVGKTFFDSANVTWGATVTISNAKYLIATMPQAKGTAATTDELLFYVDLNNASGGATVSSSAGEFTVNTPTDGWFYVNQA